MTMKNENRNQPPAVWMKLLKPLLNLWNQADKLEQKTAGYILVLTMFGIWTIFPIGQLFSILSSDYYNQNIESFISTLFSTTAIGGQIILYHYRFTDKPGTGLSLLTGSIRAGPRNLDSCVR
ncbi:MAG: hypothetical protein CVV64_19595 [Candidatus Wallbacteria bacterium HGW-Wallbacteria-1]|jgi:hypothetical protein|uniref:Uncharacterized protein n=1 Tax=Candidatus Wallbacteria bacterium HGW-Wallbacteria-1 TaxID=2013854 RepID=A0A2N1PIY9_9BACT|nr:MAG: hypothetical protein CVV64_19595 [Candidatus Wallbacteria bacterium HGW-Wallbacteria-1]